MTYFPKQAPAYWCHNCGKWWQPADPPVGCLVQHPPGSCCHYKETECDPPKPKVAA